MVNEFHLTINHEKIIKFQLLNEIIIDKIIIKWSYIFLQKPKKEIALKHVQEASSSPLLFISDVACSYSNKKCFRGIL